MKRITQPINPSLIGMIGAGSVLLLASGASAQNLFVSDYNTGDIYEYSSGGVQTTFATGLEEPSGLAFDSSGDLFVTDEERGNIYEYLNNGGTLSSTASLYASGFSAPTDIAFDSSGNMYISNDSQNDIIKIAGGTKSTFVGGLNQPWGVAYHGGNLFVANEAGNTITEVTAGGTPSTFAGGLSNPGLGLVFNTQGDLFVGNVNNYTRGGGSITEFTPSGTPSNFASGIGTPSGMAFDNAGDLFVGQGGSSDILEFSSSGTLLQTISLSGAQNVNGLAFQPVPEPKLIVVLATGGATFVMAAGLRKHKALSTEMRSK